MEATELTIEKIDVRLAEIPTQLKELDELIKVKTEQLGRSKIRGLLTPPILKSIRALEDEQRELLAEQEALKQERERIQTAIAKEAAEAAAAKYWVFREQLNPLATEIINGLLAIQMQLDKYQKTEQLMKVNGEIAGIPTAGGVITIQTSDIENRIYQALYRLRHYNNPETLEKAGIDILGFYQERDRRQSSHYVTGVESSESNASEPDQPVIGFDAAMSKAARLPVE